jgi:F-type H+-transporting ATPase subunit b
MVARICPSACELKNKAPRSRDTAVRDGLITCLRILVVACALLYAAPVSAQPPDHSQPRPQEVAPGIAAEPTEHEEEEHHSVWAGLLWPTVNFAILFGALWYFLKTPMANYLRDRHTAIRKELVEAANVTATASAQLAEIEQRLHALPGEIEALRQRSAEEIASEEARIAALATAERDRLLEQTRREIDLQVRLAKRALVEHAADLSVQLAADRIEQQITPFDQERLVDQYLTDVKRPA